MIMNHKDYYNNSNSNNNFKFTNMNKDFKFTLAHYRDIKCHQWNRKCPHCGQREFSPYINVYTGEPLDDKSCGKCNRETNCGYHEKPKDWFEKHRPEREWLPKEEYIARKRQERREAEEARRRYEEQQRKKPRFDCFASEQHPKVEDYLECMGEWCEQSQSYTHALAQWLYTKFPRERANAMLKRYRVGGTRDGRTVYWQTDLRGRVRAGKVMGYGLDGHRLKGVAGAINWVHAVYKMEQLAPQCLFGEHLLGVQEKPLSTEEFSLVEGEKTAIAMSILMPKKIWLATGGKQNFKHELLWPICGLDVAVYPDADALDEWTAKVEELNRDYGYRMYIPDNYRAMCTPESKERKQDLADMLLMDK